MEREGDDEIYFEVSDKASLLTILQQRGWDVCTCKCRGYKQYTLYVVIVGSRRRFQSLNNNILRVQFMRNVSTQIHPRRLYTYKMCLCVSMTRAVYACPYTQLTTSSDFVTKARNLWNKFAIAWQVCRKSWFRSKWNMCYTHRALWIKNWFLVHSFPVHLYTYVCVYGHAWRYLGGRCLVDQQHYRLQQLRWLDIFS